MSSYTEIDTALLDLDFTNPRIQNYLQNYPEESRSGELLAMLLGTGTDSCASLKESIKEHGGIINPIIVNHFPDGRYVVIEGNTRLQIYRDFIRDNVPGNWNKIRAIIYENLENNEMHSIRLQAHLVGPRDWDAYAKAKYLTFLSDEEKMPIEDEDVYVRAITLCARAGIDHMSNYLLYNGEDFTGKGHSYHADTPEDLFYRMHLTMELGENLTEELGRKIAIFSFPMRYIPLDNDQRGFIGANWNAKYLRALQCMLIPTQGKGIQGRSFFEADFGKTAEDFVMYLAMPERLLNKRGHFVERKDEPKFEREIRYTQWSENRHLIDTWMKYYSMFEKDTVLEYIGCNRFSVETLDKIENEELKKLYFFYLTPSATIRVFSDCTEDTKRIISTFILEELPFMYSRIVETILSSKPGYKVIAGILENFGEKVCTDLLKKIDLFSGHDNDKLTMLIKANKSKRLVDFDFSLLQFIPYFHVSNLLSKQEEQIIMNSAYELKEAPIRKILLLHLDELKDVLIKTNGAQPGDTQIISVIEEQIKELYHQISIFEL